jgi:hypothetical protein
MPPSGEHDHGAEPSQQVAVLEHQPPAFCAQCYGRGTVRIAGRKVPCTCTAWPLTKKRRG